MQSTVNAEEMHFGTALTARGCEIQLLTVCVTQSVLLIQLALFEPTFFKESHPFRCCCSISSLQNAGFKELPPLRVDLNES